MKSKIIFKAVASTLMVFAITFQSCKKQETITSQEVQTTSKSVEKKTTAFSLTINNTQDIQTALNTCEANGGGTVYLRSGWYYIDNTILIPNHCTLRSVATESVPVIRLRDGKDCPIIQNKYIPFSYVNVVRVDIRGGLTDSEMNLPAYFHKGEQEYNDRISSGTESKASLDARIDAARLKIYGISFTDNHNSNIRNYNAVISDCYVSGCSMGVEIGRTTNVLIKNTKVNNNGAVSKYYHGLYLSSSDKMVVDGLEAFDNVAIGLKITDFQDVFTETTNEIKNCNIYNNKWGLKLYHFNGFNVHHNTVNNNSYSGIELSDCQNGLLTYNTATGNAVVDIKFISVSGMTQNNNTYVTKSGF
ncbi:right-handed parallel beta-helix repeat-containing protein [Mucilaginibacter terrae]|uniref:right-handed parallel beta-helix repeat-containing protein n=1 Tax=Mucilaginibacter terrae TaxID=1955052 RepID=UPI00362F6D84